MGLTLAIVPAIGERVPDREAAMIGAAELVDFVSDALMLVIAKAGETGRDGEKAFGAKVVFALQHFVFDRDNRAKALGSQHLDVCVDRLFGIHVNRERPERADEFEEARLDDFVGGFLETRGQPANFRHWLRCQLYNR